MLPNLVCLDGGGLELGMGGRMELKPVRAVMIAALVSVVASVPARGETATLAERGLLETAQGFQLAQNRGPRPSPGPQDGGSRRHVDTTRLAAANALTAKLRSARSTQDLHTFFNHAAPFAHIADEIARRLPEAVRQEAEHRNRGADPERAYQYSRLLILMQPVRAANMLSGGVGQAILDFAVATTPIAVDRIEIVPWRGATRIPEPVHVAVGEDIEASVLLWLRTPGGFVLSPRGIARNFLYDLGLYSETALDLLEDVIIRTVRNIVVPRLRQIEVGLRAPDLDRQRVNHERHLARQREIYERAFERWLSSRGSIAVNMPAEESGPVDVTDGRVIQVIGMQSSWAGMHGLKLFAPAFPGSVQVFVRMTPRYRSLTEGHAVLPVQVGLPEAPRPDQHGACDLAGVPIPRGSDGECLWPKG